MAKETESTHSRKGQGWLGVPFGFMRHAGTTECFNAKQMWITGDAVNRNLKLLSQPNSARRHSGIFEPCPVVGDAQSHALPEHRHDGSGRQIEARLLEQISTQCLLAGRSPVGCQFGNEDPNLGTENLSACKEL